MREDYESNRRRMKRTPKTSPGTDPIWTENDIPHPYISRVSNATTSSRCQATRFSIQILRSQLRWLGHILRRPETDPLRLVVFEPGTELLPRLTSTGRKRVVGRPRIDWAQTLIEIYCSFAQCSRSRMLEIVSDKSKHHFIVERLRRHTARQEH